MESAPTSAIKFLQAKKARFRLFQHTGQIYSLDQAAEERNQKPEQVVRSIVFRLSDGKYLMVLVPGPAQVPWKVLRRYLGTSRLTMASEHELLESTGYVPGTVTPFGLPGPMRILIDERILAMDEVSLGSGQRGLAIIIKPEDMLSLLDLYELVNFSGEES